LRDLRVSFGLSQGQVADLLRISSSAVNRWENGQEIPGPAQLLLSWLFHGQAPFESRSLVGGHVLDDIGSIKMTVDAFEECLRRSREVGFASVTEWIAHLVREELGADPKAIPERREVRYGNVKNHATDGAREENQPKKSK
jgi:hypothetical protein